MQPPGLDSEWGEGVNGRRDGESRLGVCGGEMAAKEHGVLRACSQSMVEAACASGVRVG